MKHTMNLQPFPFEAIASGQKKIEVRLLDDKRKLVKIGDEIEFVKEPNKEEKVSVKVIGLLNYNSFESLVNDFDSKAFGHPTKEHLLETIYSFYTKENAEKYSVLGIRI